MDPLSRPPHPDEQARINSTMASPARNRPLTRRCYTHGLVYEDHFTYCPEEETPMTQSTLPLDTGTPAPEDNPDYEAFMKIATELGRLVAQKNMAYGKSYHKSGQFLRLLYPNGIQPDQYQDALALVRIFDKQMRLATHKVAFGESPYRDIVGYGILGVHYSEPLDAPDLPLYLS